MSLGEKIDISLDEEGWGKLDYASIAVRGEISKIISEMQAILDDDVVMSLCERIGIASTAFLFHDFFKNKTRFFEIGEDPPTYQTRYLWDDQQPHNDWSNCVHWLFLKVRERQYEARKLGNLSAEDYFANIPGDGKDYRGLGREEEWRQAYGIHYCTAGEMLYTVFVWRVLSFANESGLGSSVIDNAFIETDTEKTISDCTWLGERVVSMEPSSGEDDANIAAGQFSIFWEQAVKRKKTWYEEWETLLLAGVEPDVELVHRNAVLRFLEYSGFCESGVIQVINDSSKFNMVLQHAIPKYLEWVNAGKEVATVADALAVVEKNARFPILPFFYWNALNKAPMCYLVVPVWTSQQYSITVPSGKCRHLGLALTAARPLANLDWTLGSGLGRRESQVDILVIVNFLRLMARPLVESNLYQWLLREVEEHHVDKASEKINAKWNKKKDRRGERQ